MAQQRGSHWDFPNIAQPITRVEEDDGDTSSELQRVRLEAWSSDDLQWVRVKANSAGELATTGGGGGGGGGGAVTIADGADVAQGDRGDTAWDVAASDATVIAILKSLRVYFQRLTEYQKRIDDAGSGVTYVGKTSPGGSSAASIWQIQKITESSGDVTILWADGDVSYDNVWDNRAALSYS
jgi:hypothetical protein